MSNPENIGCHISRPSLVPGFHIALFGETRSRMSKFTALMPNQLSSSPALRNIWMVFSVTWHYGIESQQGVIKTSGRYLPKCNISMLVLYMYALTALSSMAPFAAWYFPFYANFENVLSEWISRIFKVFNTYQYFIMLLSFEVVPWVFVVPFHWEIKLHN